MKSVVVTPAAQGDIERIANWYEGKSEGLGVAFTDCVREAIDRIRLSPEGYARVFGDARKVQFRKFRDYSLWFQIKPNNLLVVACLSSRMNPTLVKETALGVRPIRPPESS